MPTYSASYVRALTTRYRDWMAHALRLRCPHLLDPTSRASYSIVLHLVRSYRPTNLQDLRMRRLRRLNKLDHATFVYIMNKMPPVVLNDFCQRINSPQITDHRMGEGEELPFPGYPLMERHAFVVGCHLA